MKNGWRVKPLSEVCDIRNGSTPSKGNRAFWDGGTVPWFTIDDMREQGRSISSTRQKITQTALSETSVKLLPEDSVLLCCTASVGEFAITRIPLTTNQQFNGLVVRDRNQLDPNFLFHYAATLKDELLGLSGKTTIDFIPISRLREVIVPVPPLPEQQRIVGILDEAFEGIATAKANAEKNLQNARALFESHLQSVFTQRGPGWMEKSLGNLASFRNGINYTQNSKGEHIKIVGVRNFQKHFSAPLDDLDTVTIDGQLSELDSLRQDDILAVRSNGNIELIGRSLLVGEVTENISHSGFTIRIRLSNAEVLPRYLCHFMKSASSRKRLTDGGTGTNIKSLNQGMLSALAIPFPPISVQKILVKKLESISEETQRLATLYERKLAALDELKKSLLHHAFAGEL
jgi:type I restriction enzyme S subunit